VSAALLGATASAAESDPPTCPPGYLGVMTLDDALVFYASGYTDAEIRAGFALHGLNGNGIICRQHPPAFDLERFAPSNLVIDDLATGPRRR
jgi:hypothetical protein